ncbi:hypothetical protein [Variovorax sp. JS1663]|uniref:hypothetical protein n=1 Tax=Variovorax sp. JS1663 TaxID=1851577 RepID=UPI0018648C41|nr:hypothetical protein [Variovorax sp. JS1663]
MQSAPSVSYPVGRSRIAGRLLLGLWAGGVCCAIAAGLHFHAVDWRSGLLLMVVVGAGVAARVSTLRHTPAATLHFDGLCWSIPGTAGQQAFAAKVALDAQSSLLVRLASPGGARRWVWLDRHAAPERWQALRRAVYSRPAPAGHSLAVDRSATAAGSPPLFP